MTVSVTVDRLDEMRSRRASGDRLAAAPGERTRPPEAAAVVGLIKNSSD
jgi:hypothetical protein